MCKELKLIQTHLGIWKLEDWDIQVCQTQLIGRVGIYCIKNLINNKLLIGEGRFTARLNAHFRHSYNRVWLKNVKKYGKENFKLIWIIEENNEIKRKLIENKLQIYFKDSCYNKSRRKYPSQHELLNHTSKKIGCNPISIVEKLKNYTKIQRVDGFDECWESNYCTDTGGYGMVYYNSRYKHHILMYILYHGDICGISSIIHHKCENKKCVNPEHLELTTHLGNMQKYYNNLKSLPKSNYGAYYEKQTQKYKSCILIESGHITLGRYNTLEEALQNRDYYIVKNNLLDKPQTTLNYHNIDYYNFTPHKTSSNKINKYIGETWQN